MLLLAILACDAGKNAPDGAEDSAPPTCEVVVEVPAGKDLGDGPRPARLLTGAITWTLEFDAGAEAAGYFDCSYRRDYYGVEATDQGYLCPDCTLFSRATADMTEGYADCFAQIDDAAQERVEAIGFGVPAGATDDQEHFFRSVENVTLGDMGPVVAGAETLDVSWTDEATLGDDAGEEIGAMVLSAAGTFAVGISGADTVDDPTGARSEPYACGWPTNSPGGADPDPTLAVGSIFPDLHLVDQCGEAVDLWDFRGYYLVIDSSAPNCGPCQALAGEAEAFKAEMAAACIPMEMITLLNESLSAVNQPADAEMLDAWVEEFGITSPVLADRGAAYALFPDFLGMEDGMSFPAMVVVDPDGRVIHGSSGVGEDGWGPIQAVIEADFAGR